MCSEEGRRLLLRRWPRLGRAGCLGWDEVLCVPLSPQERSREVSEHQHRDSVHVLQKQKG